MESPGFDTLIIGQGLAGTALAWHLMQAGERVCVVDDGHRTASSVVAAGLLNPLAGLRFNRRPDTTDCLDAADRWYAALAGQFGRDFHHPMPMLRLFRSEEQRRFHARRRRDPASRALLDEALPPEHLPEPIAAPFGAFVQHRTGYVDLPGLLEALRAWLDGQGALAGLAVDPSAIRPTDDRVEVAGLSASRLVFCEGARMADNPWFCRLPLRPEKGEILDLEAGDWRPRHIINGAYWVVPQADGRLRLGATHQHRQIDRTATTAGRDELLAAWGALRPKAAPVTVRRHQAGVRPGTADRQPLIGRHPAQPRLWVFNGFGARGALAIPWYAQRLAEHLRHGRELPADADIRRLA